MTTGRAICQTVLRLAVLHPSTLSRTGSIPACASGAPPGRVGGTHEMPGGTPGPRDRIPILGGSRGNGVASPDRRGGAAVLPGTFPPTFAAARGAGGRSPDRPRLLGVFLPVPLDGPAGSSAPHRAVPFP